MIKIKFIISLGICHVIWVCQVLSAFHTAPCGSVQPIYGMMLKRHVFQSMKTSNSLQCSMACDNDIICQSFNYAVTEEICELNNRTKEATPKDLVPNKNGFYMKRFIKRGRNAAFMELKTLGLSLWVLENYPKSLTQKYVKYPKVLI